MLLLSLFTATACIKENVPGPEEVHRKEVVAKFHITLTLGGKDMGGRTRADGELGGTAHENHLSSVTLFVVACNETTEQLDWTNVKYVTLLAPPSLSLSSSETVDIITTTGKKQIFIGANMSAQQIVSFVLNRGVFRSAGVDYRATIADFVHPTNGITMFGTAVDLAPANPAKPEIIEVRSNAPDYDIEVDLERVVAKVALVYSEDDPLNPSGNVEMDDVTGSYGGFMPAEKVYFMLNNTSKTVNFLHAASGTFNIGDYISYDTSGGGSYYYNTDPRNDFVVYTPTGLIYGQGNTESFGTPQLQLPLDDDDPYCASPGIEVYDPTKGDNQKHYDSFLYCLENRVSTSGFGSLDPTLVARQGINTQVIVAARYVPGKIKHFDGSTLDLVTVSDMVGMDAITALDPNGPGTFYAVYTGNDSPDGYPIYDYHTYGAIEHYEGQPIEDQPAFIVHKSYLTYKGGYGYYTTFISQPKADKTNDSAYNLDRNYYYVLNITKMTPPGASVTPQREYMLINSETEKWINVGEPIEIPVNED